MSAFETQKDAPPQTPGAGPQKTGDRWQSYAIGLVVALALTIGSFAMAGASDVMTPSSLVAGLIVLAIAQMIAHLIFFLHITTAPAHKTNILSLLVTLLIIVLVIVGSLTIMSHLNANMMMPMDKLMEMQR